MVKKMYDDVFGRKEHGKGLIGRKMKNRINWKRIEVGDSENKTDIPERQFVFRITLGYLLFTFGSERNYGRISVARSTRKS